jgi:hypothetical protein
MSMKRGDEDIIDEHLPFSDRLKANLIDALHESLDAEQENIGTQHLFLGMLRGEEGLPVKALQSLRFEIESARLALLNPGDTLTIEDVQQGSSASYFLWTSKARRRTSAPPSSDGTDASAVGSSPESDATFRLKSPIALADEISQMWRRLAAKDPCEHLPQLADSLEILTLRYVEMDDYEHAAEIAQDALTQYRELCRTDFAAHAPTAADLLHRLGSYYERQERDSDAIAAVQEAVDLRRQIYQSDAANGSRNLAHSLEFLSALLYWNNQPDESLEAASQAVEIRRSNPPADPEIRTAELNRSIAYLMQRLAALQRNLDAAIAYGDEVRNNIRAFVERGADTAPWCLRNLSATLELVSDIFSDLVRIEESLEAGQEARELRLRISP